MWLRLSARHPTAILRLGMAFLAVGMVSLRYLTRWTHLSPGIADGVAGLALGFAIALLLLSMRARGHR